MRKVPHSPFLFTTCQVGAEAALKKEMARIQPGLKFAFSRPGFVTFKAASGELGADFALESVFARTFGLSFGKTKAGDPEPIRAFTRDLKANWGERALKLHAWERDQHFPGDEPLGYLADTWISNALKALPCLKDGFESSSPHDGDLVMDLVAVEPEEWWYGCHVHSPLHPPVAGGKFRVELPPNAPSRAYVKLEEALRWGRVPVRKGDVAVEIGSAPGGASWALLRRGIRVTGIDPGEMDARVLADPGFAHIRRPVGQVLREELPDPVHWLLLDMNVEPRISLFAVDRLATRMRDSLLGLVLTVKLNSWSIADEIPQMLEHVRAMGMVRARATQLASNRQEILILGLTRKGLLRPAA